jgi:hypothetical protein
MASFLPRPATVYPLRTFAAAVLVFHLVGCAGGVPKGSVSGKVTFEGKAVRSGSVMFVRGGSPALYSQIDDDGKYEVQGVPAGTAKVTVASPDPSGGGRGRTIKGAPAAPARGEGGGPPVKGWVPIPNQYSDPERSGLSFGVRPGANTFHIELK